MDILVSVYAHALCLFSVNSSVPNSAADAHDQTLLGTQYITISTNSSGVSIMFAREMYIFLVLTVVLLAVTAGGWLLWERQHRLADRSKEDWKETGEMV